jgi:hypothetical protein
VGRSCTARITHERERERRFLPPPDVGPRPAYIGNDLDAVADQLIGRYPASAMTLATGE